LLADLLAIDPAARPSAAQLVARVSALREAPLRRARRLTRWALSVGLVGIAAASAIGYWRADQSRRDAEEALARAQAANDFLTDLFGRASPDGLGPKATLRDLLDAAPAMMVERPSLRPLDRAHLLNVLSGIEYGMANDESAARLADQAAKAAQSVAPESDDTLRLRATALRFQAIAGQAEAAMRDGEALLASAQAQRRDPALIAYLEFCLGEAEFRYSLVRSSPALTQRLQARMERVLAKPELLDVRTESDALRRLANLRIEAGRHAEGVALAELAVQHAEQGLGAAHPIAALNRRVLAWHLMEGGPPDRAEALFRTNLAQHADRLGRRSRNVADDLIGLSQALTLQRRKAEALAVASEGFALASELYERGSRTPIDAALTLAEAQHHSGLVAESAQLLRDTRDLLTETRGTDNRQYVLATRQLALLLAASNDAAQARPLLVECVGIATRVMGESSPLAASCTEELDKLGS
jgi:hypothetical protein